MLLWFFDSLSREPFPGLPSAQGQHKIHTIPFLETNILLLLDLVDEHHRSCSSHPDESEQGLNRGVLGKLKIGERRFNVRGEIRSQYIRRATKIDSDTHSDSLPPVPAPEKKDEPLYVGGPFCSRTCKILSRSSLLVKGFLM